MAHNLRSNSNAGHNSTGMIDGEGLKRFVDRGIACVEARKAANEDYAVVIEEAKEAGFVGKQVRQLVREAMMEPAVLADSLAQMDALRHALGQFSDTPLGEAAVEATGQREERSRHRRRTKAEIEDALAKAAAHLNGSSGDREAAPVDPAEAGRNAAASHLPESHNPHDLGTPESALWLTAHRNAIDAQRLAAGAAPSPYEDDGEPDFRSIDHH